MGGSHRRIKLGQAFETAVLNQGINEFHCPCFSVSVLAASGFLERRAVEEARGVDGAGCYAEGRVGQPTRSGDFAAAGYGWDIAAPGT